MAGLSILFVDDEPNSILAHFRILRLKEPEWTVHLSTSAEQALQVLHREDIDVVVSDMLMGGMNGVRFLAIVQARYPRIARIALSGMIDAGHFLKPAAPLTDHYLCKPCTPEKLRAVILQAAAAVSAKN